MDPSQYEVHSVGETEADVKEASRFPGMRVWAVEHYDWSEPDVVSWTVRESNFSAPGSRVIARLEPRPGGGTRIHLDWQREGTTPAGKLAVSLIALTNGAPIRASIRKGLARLEANTA